MVINLKMMNNILLQKTRKFILLLIVAFWCAFFTAPTIFAQEIPVRGYTNPDEIVTFDRTTSYQRALDVINRFAQEYAGKLIIDRSGFEGPIGITIPPMYWREALELILSKHYLTLVERRKYFEIVPYSRNAGGGGVTAAAVPDTALTTSSKEVRIHAIFFEGNRSALQEIGVDWSTLTNNVPEGVGAFFGQGGGGGGAGGGELPVTGEGFSDGPFVNVNSKGAQFVSQNVFNAVINFGEVFGSGVSVQALFSAFEAENLGTVLASPSIRVLEGQVGRIQVGTDFAINQRDFAGNVITQFYSAGTILEVVPRIIEYRDTSFIHLDIHVEKSSVVPATAQTTINTQNADSQVLLLDGETTVIAGLYQTQKSLVRKGIPILKDLPAWFFGLRYIFGYTSKRYETRELIVLIKAEIVPSIKRRMDLKLAGTFDVLQDERLRMRKKVIKYRESLKYPDVLPTDDPQNIFEEEHKLNPPPDTEIDEELFPEEVEERNESYQEQREEYVQSNLEVNSERRTLYYPDEEQKTEAKQNGASYGEKKETEEDGKKVSNTISPDTETYQYYIIGGSFKNRENAEQFRRRLKRLDYKSEILVSVRDGFYMVSYKGFNRKYRALDFLSEIKRTTNEQAWLFNNFE